MAHGDYPAHEKTRYHPRETGRQRAIYLSLAIVGGTSRLDEKASRHPGHSLIVAHEKPRRTVCCKSRGAYMACLGEDTRHRLNVASRRRESRRTKSHMKCV